MPAHERSEIEPENLRPLFETLVTLLRHSDKQITNETNYHFVALGSLIPMFALLIKIESHWAVYVGIILLAVAFALHWLSSVTKLGLERLSWTRLVRNVEAQLYGATGPFTVQKSFLDSPPREFVGRLDRMLVQRSGSLRKVAPILILTLAMLVTAIIGLVAGGKDS